MFEKGDKVWNVDFGWGVVYDIVKSDAYPVKVEFAYTDKHLTYTYTMDGKTIKSGFRSLFFDELIIPETALARKRWRAKDGGSYYYIGSAGDIHKDTDSRFTADSLRYKTGNYFETEKEAMESKFYKMYREEI